MDRREVDARLLAMLDEDIGEGDVTTALFPDSGDYKASFAARCEGIMCGGLFVKRLFALHDPSVIVNQVKDEGAQFKTGQVLIQVTGNAASLLGVERTALNLLSRLCGVATKTALFAKLIGGKAVLLDTRKTTPMLRVFEKYAVRVGGGVNHRAGLFDQVLVKDNHVTLLTSGKASFADIVASARRKYGPIMIVELEVDTMEQFLLALESRPDIILLDNMDPLAMAQCVVLRNAFEATSGIRVLLEASGGINEGNIGKVAKSGVDRISVGSLTYAPYPMDIGLDFVGKVE
jgi:nicotinate-nucleotide pyrophosphorylase (carboxylating)